MMADRGKANLGFWMLRVAGSAAILAVLFWLMPVDAFWDALQSVSPAVFAMVFLGFLAIHVAAALKWRFLMRGRVPVTVALRAHFAGLAANLCLPGAVGGDAVRGMIAHRWMRDGARVVAAATADRMIDFAALGVLVLEGLILTGAEGGVASKAGWTVGCLVAVLAAMTLLPRQLPRLWDLVPRLGGRGMALRLAEAFGEFSAARLALAFAASLSIQSALVALSWVLAMQTGLATALGPWLFAWPLAKLLAVLPISLGGLGLREGVLAALLAPFGAATAAVVAAGLMWQAVLFCGGAVGGLVFALTQGERRQVAQ